MTCHEISEPVDRSRRRWIRRSVAAGASLLLPVTGVQAFDGLATEIKAIKDRGRLSVGMADFSSPPFFDDSQHSGDLPDRSSLRGSDIDLARHLALVLDVDVVFDRRWTSFNAVVDAVAAGHVDVGISKLSATADRAVKVLFSRPIITPRHALLINRLSLAKRAGATDPLSIINRDFDGKVGVIAQSSYVTIARNILGKADIQEFPSWEAAISAVETGQVDLAYRDEIEIKKLVRSKPDLHLNLRSAVVTDFHDSIAVALPSNSRQLQALLNIIIESSQKISVDQLLDKYLT